MNCFQGEQYLEEALNSVLNQTYTNWELIFWDNCSKDSSMEIIKKYTDSRIKIFQSKKHTNLGEARKLAFTKVKGEFLAFLDVDDIWFKDKLEQQLPYFQDINVGVNYTNCIWFSKTHKEKLYSSNFVRPISNSKLITNYYLSLQTILIRVSAISSLNVDFDASYSHISDFDLITRLATVSELSYCPKVTAGWRIHTKSEGYTKPSKFISEKKLWVRKNILNSNFRKDINSIIELSKILSASDRFHKPGFPIINLRDIFFKFSTLRNFLYVTFSFVPILPYILMRFKSYLYRTKWFRS